MTFLCLLFQVEPKLQFYQKNGKFRAQNKCRNSVKENSRGKVVPVQSSPWCYTTRPDVFRETCGVTWCPERRKTCATGHCMDYHGRFRKPLVSHLFNEGCQKHRDTGYENTVNTYSVPPYARKLWYGVCGNAAIGKDNPYGRLTGPWCPIIGWGNMDKYGERFRWAPCEVPLHDDRELTMPVHYTHREVPTRLFIFWRLKMATVRFWLRAWSDYRKGAAVLYVTEFPGPGVAAVEIIIGWLNKESKICIRSNGFIQERCVVKSTPNIISAEEWREFWVRLDAGMVEFGYAGEGRPLIRTSASDVGNFAYLATANDVLDPEHNTPHDERRHINMWAFQKDLLAFRPDEETEVENEYCQEFNTVGASWYSHIFKMKPLTDRQKALYAGSTVWEDRERDEDLKNYQKLKMHDWTEFEGELYLGADVWIRAPPTGTVFLLSTWPGVMDKETVNVKIIFDNGHVDVNAHNCNPTRPYDCYDQWRSQNEFWQKLKSVHMYNGGKRPWVRLSLGRWTRIMIISQTKIFRIITFDEAGEQVTGAYSYDLMHFGLMSDKQFEDTIKSGFGYKNRENNIYRMYGKADGVLEAHQFRYIGFGSNGDIQTPPVVAFVRLHCKNVDRRPLTKYPNCIQDTDAISTRHFQGTWPITEEGELCTSWSSLLIGWRLLLGDLPPESDWSKEGTRNIIGGVGKLIDALWDGKVSPTSRDTGNNCRNFPRVQYPFCFVKRYGRPRGLLSRQSYEAGSEAKEPAFFDMPTKCELPLCEYTECRGTFLGQTYRGKNRSTGFIQGEECAHADDLEDFDKKTYGEYNYCLNDKRREKLGVDRPFCYVKANYKKPVRRYCNSAPLCTLNPIQHIYAVNELQLRLHSNMPHYTHIGVRAVTPTIRELGVIACLSDMQWDSNSNTVCIYIGNNFFLGMILRFKTPMSSKNHGFADALLHGTFTEVTSLNLAKELTQPQIEGLTFNWFWFKFCSEFLYIGRGGAVSPLMAVPYSDKVFRAAKKISGNNLDFSPWLKYVQKIQVGDGEPLTKSMPKSDPENHKRRSNSANRVFKNLLLHGNPYVGQLFAFNPKKLRNMCPLFSLQATKDSPVSFSLNRIQTLENGATEVLVEFNIKFSKRQTNKEAGFQVRFAESANGKENGFAVYDVIFTHRRKEEMRGYAPLQEHGNPGDGDYALLVVQHRPSKDPEYLKELEREKQKYDDIENPLWNDFGPVHFIDDITDRNWHHFIIRIITNSNGDWEHLRAELHVEVPLEHDYKCIFKEKVEGSFVADIQYVSFTLLDGSEEEALLLLDLLGDDCDPPTDKELEPVVRDGGWGMWSAWDCSAECDGGFGSRERLCNNPEPTLWGHDCVEWNTPRQFGLCNNHKCGTFSDETRRRMLYSLANDPLSLDLREEEEFVLRCQTDAYQAAIEQFSLLDTIWLRNGHKWQADNNRMELQGTDVLVRNASRNDTGVYSCLVQPSPGVTGIVALVAVVVRTGNVTRRAMTGDQLQFNCQGDLFDQVYDDLLHFWYLDGQLYSYMGNRVYADESHAELVLPKMDPHDPMEPRYIAVEDIRLQDTNETLINTMTMRVASERLSGEWECVVYQPKYKLVWITNWFILEVEPYDAYRRLTLGPVAQMLVGGVKGPIVYGTAGTIGGLVLLAGSMYWFVRKRQRRIEAQMVLFKKAGLWKATGETAVLLDDEEEGEEEDDGAGGVLVAVGEESNMADHTDYDTEDSSVPPAPPMLLL